MHKDNLSIKGHIESLLVIALNRGLYLRRQNLTLTSVVRERFHESITYHLDCLDRLKCSWKIQNRALHFYNNIEDQTIYESLYKQQLAVIVDQVIDSS